MSLNNASPFYQVHTYKVKFVSLKADLKNAVWKFVGLYSEVVLISWKQAQGPISLTWIKFYFNMDK